MKNETRPRVLILSHLYPSAVDRINGIFVHQHVKALTGAGIEVMLMSPVPWAPRALWFRDNWKFYGSYPEEEVFDDISMERPRYVEFPSIRFRPFSGWSMFRCLLPHVKRLRGTFDFNIIHAHTITPDGHAATLLGRYFGVPVICSIRGSDLNEYPYFSERMYGVSMKVLEQADALITVCNDLSMKAASMARLRSTPHVIFNGVDVEVFKDFGDRGRARISVGLPADRKVIIFVGRCEREKGIFDLLEAFSGICRSFGDTTLLIVGEGKDRTAIEGLVEERNLRGRVLFAGRVPHEDLPRYLNAGDIFTLPSHAEGMPNAVFEAMACGLPVVATKVGGIPEVIDHGYDGLLCKPNDPSCLQGHLCCLLDSPGDCREIGRRAADKVRRRFLWRVNAERHLCVYEEILEEKNGRGRVH